MSPFFFGDSQRQLYGVYHPSRERSRRGAVICAPWAREYLLAHGTLRLLADKLADAGWHALRFDYLGTGDSAGDAHEAGRDQWLDDVESATEELKAIADVSEIALIGMRHGAALAAIVAGGRRDVTRVVCWDAILDGVAWLDELGAGAQAQGSTDVLGAVLTPRLRADFRGITPSLFGATPARTLFLSTGSRDASGTTAEALGAAGVRRTVDHVPDIQVWREEWGTGGKGLAVNAASHIARWLA
jgi:hypothetical protein